MDEISEESDNDLDEEDFEEEMDDDEFLDMDDDDKELIGDLDDDEEEEIEFNDNSKNNKKKYNKNLNTLFASAEEFATLLEDEGSSKIAPGSSNTFVNKDNASKNISLKKYYFFN